MVERSDLPSRGCALRPDRGAIHITADIPAGVRGNAAARSPELFVKSCSFGHRRSSRITQPAIAAGVLPFVDFS